MTNNRLSEGVGKKIVEALKKQSEIEVNPISASSETGEAGGEEVSFEEASFETFAPEEPLAQTVDAQEDDFFSSLSSDNDMSLFQTTEKDFAPEEPVFVQHTIKQSVNKPFAEAKSTAVPIVDDFSNDLDSFEIPSNIAVLKKLITQLPSGVTRHTGAQIIRQTMEALGISMKSVLQEAQQLQDGLSNSAKECQNTIQEYKKQIITLEKQSQNHQRQYTALNELISLFIQTNNR